MSLNEVKTPEESFFVEEKELVLNVNILSATKNDRLSSLET
jgi:hypothetical protein